ncbi:MAG: Flp pilus assembly protein CpaB [Solirubrobacterales bacterium]|nr:Flp pilus assembly protein CpaB [Solirubrobacterales bacterium]
MEATQKRSPLEEVRRFAGTRRGAITIAAGAAALAGIVLLTFISQYKQSVQNGTLQHPALVADRLIPKGTSGSVIVTGGFFKPASVQQDSLQTGALTSATALAGKVATHDVYPGEQLTTADFASGADPLRGQLAGDQRAINIPIDSAHGLAGAVRAGDKVDVLAGFNAANSASGRGRPELRTLAENLLVLKAPAVGNTQNGNASQNLTIRASGDLAAQLAFASDNGKIWFVLRPPAGATNTRPSSVTLDSLLSGAPTITVGP